MKERLREIDYIRCLVIIALVSYHAFAPFAHGWGHIAGCKDNAAYFWIGKLLYSGMLETFVFISGYIFAFAMARRVQTFSAMAWSKVKRLLIPSVIWSIAYLLLVQVKGFTYEAFLTPSQWYDIACGIGHLWFLPMLFWCFLMEWCLCKCCFADALWLCILLFAIAILPYPTLPLQINNSLYYLAFFHMGGVVFRHREQWKRFAFSPYLFLLLLLVYIGLFIGGTLIMETLNVEMSHHSVTLRKALQLFEGHAVRAVCSVFAVAVYYLVGMHLAERVKSARLNTLATHIAFYAMGIYILHQFIEQNLYYRFTIGTHLGLATPWLTALFTFLLSLLGAFLLKKIKGLDRLC